MRSRRLARPIKILLLGAVLVAVLLSGCQRAQPTTAGVSQVKPPTDTPAPTLAPTLTKEVIPPTETPRPTGTQAPKQPTNTPTPTITINAPLTMIAKATADRSTKCQKHPDAWPIKVEAALWKPGWCEMTGVANQYYEFQLVYPSQWTPTTFGEIYPSVYFQVFKQGVEVRLYQVYNYATKKYEGTLEDAPTKAAFCDKADKCLLVVDPLEKVVKKEIRAIGGRETLVLDTQLGKQNIRRYFFFVPFRFYNPRSNRLFVIKVYTPDPIKGDNYKDLLDPVEDVLITIKAN